MLLVYLRKGSLSSVNSQVTFWLVNFVPSGRVPSSRTVKVLVENQEYDPIKGSICTLFSVFYQQMDDKKTT